MRRNARGIPWTVLVAAPILGAATAVGAGMVLAAKAKGLTGEASLASCFQRSQRGGAPTPWVLCDSTSGPAREAEREVRGELADLSARVHAELTAPQGLIGRATHMSLERWQTRTARVDLADWWAHAGGKLQTLRIARVSAGWPLPCVTGWSQALNLKDFTPQDTVEVGLIASPPWLQTTERPDPLTGRLPLLPLWAGLIVDVVVMTAAWVVVLVVFGAFNRGVLRVWRRSRGRCPACGYARAGLTEGAACPECGR